MWLQNITLKKSEELILQCSRNSVLVVSSKKKTEEPSRVLPEFFHDLAYIVVGEILGGYVAYL